MEPIELAMCRLNGRFQPLTEAMQAEGSRSRKGKGKARDVDMDNGGREEHVNLDGVEGEWLLPEYGLTGVGNVRGSMLCEEMGLGKTLEALAVVALHPRDFAREQAERSASIEPASNQENNGGDDVQIIEDSAAESEEALRAKKRRRLDSSGASPGEGLVSVDEQGEGSEQRERVARGRTWYDEDLKLNISQVKCTLIVTPPMLLRQWIDEIRQHCPSLNYIVYNGYQELWKTFSTGLVRPTGKYAYNYGKRKLPEQKSEQEQFDEFYADYTAKLKEVDVIIVSYDTLAKDLDVAFVADERPRRSLTGPPRAKPRTVLLMCEFWRVIMDEVQMLDIHSNKAAKLVTDLKRVNSLVLSGTPARRDVGDLVSSLHFIGIKLKDTTWDRFLKPAFKPAFDALMREIAVRHTKAAVKDEADIPPQTRYIVPIKMNEVEIQYYRDLLHRNIDDMAASANGYRDTDRIRTLITTLRAVCTHLQTNDLRGGGDNGRLRRPRLNRDNGKVIEDLDQALQAMQDQAWADYYSEVTDLQGTKIDFAVALHTEHPAEHKRALEMLKWVVASCESEARKIQDKLKAIEDVVIDLDSDQMSDSDVDSEDANEQNDVYRRERRNHTQLKLRLTLIKTIWHEALFRQGDFYHQHKDEPGYSEKEDQYYAAADKIRTELLQQPLKKSNTSIGRVQDISNRSRIRNFDNTLDVEECDRMGISTEKFRLDINEFIEEAFNANALCVWDLRAEVVKRLLQPVELISGDEADGKEFEITLDKQADLDAYMTAYADALADRREMITEITTLTRQEDERKQKKRTTQTATKTAIAAAELGILIEKDDSPTVKGLKEVRSKYREAYVGKTSLQSLIADLDDFLAGHEAHRAEKELAKMEMSRLKEVKEKQLDYLRMLDDEHRALTKCFNVRLHFFMTLQKISDTLVDPEAETADLARNLRLEGEVRKAEGLEAKRRTERLAAIQRGDDGFRNAERKLAAQVAHARYLDSLSEPVAGESKEPCPICLKDDTIEEGTAFLECGHYMCIPDFDEFLRSTGPHNCPLCRKPIKPSKVRKFGGKRKKKTSERAEVVPENLPAAAEAVESAVTSSELPVAALNTISPEERAEIEQVEIQGTWGAKLDFLIKHLKFVKRRDDKLHRDREREREEAGLPSEPLEITKHIVFSAWASSLEIVKTAFRSNHITSTSIDARLRSKTDIRNAANDFKTNDHQVFLLHGERQVSGLTLTVATVVHLLEPVMHSGYELQAIGRVDRLGQTKPTSVYCYATEETIESKIINRSLAAGHCIYAKEMHDLTFHAEDTTAKTIKGADTLTGDRDDLLDLLL